jgi:hypothetical protein
MPESGTSGSVRDRDGQPPGLLDLRFLGEANRDKHSAYGSPLRGHPNAGSRQRRRKHPTSRLEAICQRVRPGLISVAGSEPSRLQASRLTLTWSRQLIQTPESR